MQKATDQVSHDNSVIHEWVLTHAQGKLQSTWRLAGWQIEAVALQQEMLQLILCCHHPAHLEWKHKWRRAKNNRETINRKHLGPN